MTGGQFMPWLTMTNLGLSVPVNHLPVWRASVTVFTTGTANSHPAVFCHCRRQSWMRDSRPLRETVCRRSKSWMQWTASR